jgi:hypothetical protein
MADTPPPSLDALIDSLNLQNASTKVSPQSPSIVGPAVPTQLERTADEMFSELNRVPLFMTHLDETDGSGGENVALEGLRALAYEGTRAEVAGNFRESGNECARARQWAEAKGYYTQALAALREPRKQAKDENGILIPLDEVEEDAKEKVVEEASYVNRALCNLELSRYTRILRCVLYYVELVLIDSCFCRELSRVQS